jgi:hypothetical protein
VERDRQELDGFEEKLAELDQFDDDDLLEDERAEKLDLSRKSRATG